MTKQRPTADISFPTPQSPHPTRTRNLQPPRSSTTGPKCRRRPRRHCRRRRRWQSGVWVRFVKLASKFSVWPNCIPGITDESSTSSRSGQQLVGLPPHTIAPPPPQHNYGGGGRARRGGRARERVAVDGGGGVAGRAGGGAVQDGWGRGNVSRGRPGRAGRRRLGGLRGHA